ncbi:HAD family hydrolase [Lachnobacterium bovis]|uniref:Putative hydrolase of the HAD superfamily n=1 Tax=Lachnobacterium bovis TaxID=140626 RepID=A0A1H9RH00_9FIRM|nr:HAD family phosphatase [Lachnobacterium bovis]SER71907.1 putative hydrolase of the HAD superfamily [Lachnobacterium bovis]
MKYKNIVFDMGNVLVKYDSDAAARQFTDDEKIIREVRLIIFNSIEWEMLDGGLITEEKALQRMLDRFETDEAREVGRKSFETWNKVCMQPNNEMGEVVRALKDKGHNVYILSNASARLPKMYKEVIPNADLFDGVFYSAPEKLLKPQREIYVRFFEKFNLDPSTCLFIDDLEDNITASKAAGMDGYCYADGDINKLKKFLELN